MSAQVTEAHRAITESVCELLDSEEMVGPSPAERAAQLIADSEARATERANTQVGSLISSAKNAIPASEHPAEPTVENWAWQIRNLGDDRRLVYAERDQLRAKVRAVLKIVNEQTARAETAEREVADLKANNRFHRGHSAGYAEAKADCEAELATERARLDWLLSRMGGNVLPANKCVAWTVDVYHYKNQFPSRAAIDAAIKEGA